MNRDEFRKLADQRLREAQILLAGGLWSGAYYLAGYAVEFALKGIIAAQFIADDIPDKKFVEKIWTHVWKSRLISLDSSQSSTKHRVV